MSGTSDWAFLVSASMGWLHVPHAVAQLVSTVFSQHLVGSALQPDIAVPKYLRDIFETKFYSLPLFPALDSLSRCPRHVQLVALKAGKDYVFLKAAMPL